MNMCTFTGRLGRDAVTRAVSDTTVTGFSLASDVGFGDRKSTLWLDCSIWGNRGKAIEDYLLKGVQATVIGELSEREYEDKNTKETRKSLSIRVVEIQFTSTSQNDESAQNDEPVLDDKLDDDIPF